MLMKVGPDGINWNVSGHAGIALWTSGWSKLRLRIARVAVRSYRLAGLPERNSLANWYYLRLFAHCIGIVGIFVCMADVRTGDSFSRRRYRRSRQESATNSENKRRTIITTMKSVYSTAAFISLGTLSAECALRYVRTAFVALIREEAHQSARSYPNMPK